MIENPLLQQRAFLDANAVIRLDRKVIEISGEDRKVWLHNMLSQDIRSLNAGDSAEALLLDAQGHILADLHLISSDASIFAVVASSQAHNLLDWFQKAKFRSKVAWQAVDCTVFASWEKPFTNLAWQDRWPATTAGGYRYGDAAGEPWRYFENLVFAGEKEPAGEILPESALDAIRIAAHRPFASEMDEKSLPHELNLLATAVHLSKGCYRGQETVAKVHNLGHPPRRLVMLHLDGSEHVLPEVATEVVFDGRTRGVVTSVGQHYEMGPIALAVIARGVPETAQVFVAGKPANQEVIVPSSAGATVEKRNVARRGLL